ncbi:MAG TPA: DUF4290 domain-containing protein, partial [Panacibacter sp.]|nr:DUF4290 domain-containing protein [Panacibacter sp.]
FANAIAYYMKLAYSNWHKELVHDDAIRGELNRITGGELEFSNTPYIKHRNPGFESDDFRSGTGTRRQNFANRSTRDNRGDSRDNNMRGRDNRSDNRDMRNARDSRDLRNNTRGDNRNNNSNSANRNPNFKKRFK